MTKLKALALAGAVAAAWGRLAIAADLPPAPPLPPPSPPDFGDFSGWYLRGDVGMGIATAPNLENKPDPVALGVSSGFLSPYANQGFYNTTLSPFGMIDVGLGYQLNNWFRVDGTLEYRGGANLQSLYALTDSASPAVGGPLQYADFYRANVASVVGLINGYVNLPTYWGISPFVGVGVGFADNSVNGFTDQGFGYSSYGSLGSSGGYFAGGSKASFAWALMAGLDFDLTPNLKLEASYRYLNYGTITTGGSNCLSGGRGGVFSSSNCNGNVPNHVLSRNQLASNDFQLGLIWLVGEPAPPPPPVIARY